MAFKSDIPSRDPFKRNGFVRARVDAVTYLVDFGGLGGTEVAFYPGSLLLSIGAGVTAEWKDEMGMWYIAGADSVIIANQSGETVENVAPDIDGWWIPEGAGAPSGFTTTDVDLNAQSTSTLLIRAFAFVWDNVPAGVTQALLNVYGGTQDLGNNIVDIYGYDVDAPVQPANGTAASIQAGLAGNPTTFRTTAFSSFIEPIDDVLQTVDVTAIFLEVQARPGWVDGNSMVLNCFKRSDGIGNNWGFRSRNHATNKPSLDLTRGVVGTQPQSTEAILAGDLTYTPINSGNWNF